jgi:hypothetical protein
MEAGSGVLQFLTVSPRGKDDVGLWTMRLKTRNAFDHEIQRSYLFIQFYKIYEVIHLPLIIFFLTY